MPKYEDLISKETSSPEVIVSDTNNMTKNDPDVLLLEGVKDEIFPTC
ncbi:hypothetical protein XBFFL1_1640058 [Xenorhabdus bovienii str. feltiae Florida]|uniref:Uncharacterized protein n=1 Tax=Xenorhabdus bovienii str. feltiae Moldova TaxID=1398200 RepID=A0A077NQ49_XENBV|nr:hypothetical protein XBFFR1_1990023 [Xenorhabdus bovienii str. feltiae France]CDG91546.1 hypothetical protein XBFFL1_1640058 [Xenorhabdus bovienii str. feltiae Florida]CDG99806.1 hypothetical protein XBFM1_120013 [Xenorhabdus bovienii str. feltiae Moldova]